jgi:hypothetical protein
MSAIATIYSSHGEIDIDNESGIALARRIDGDLSLVDILRFDVERWKRDFPGETLVEEDIVCIGYWTYAAYEPPVDNPFMEKSE